MALSVTPYEVVSLVGGRMPKMKRSKLRVEIVYMYEGGGWERVSERARLGGLLGSDAMRLQVRESMAPYLPEHIELVFSGLSRAGRGLSLVGRWRHWYFQSWLQTRRPAVFILLKNIAYRLTPDEITQLKKKAIAVGVDHKFGDPWTLDLSLYDFHISATESGRRAIESTLAVAGGNAGKGPFAGAWYQSFDQRLKDVQFRDLDRLSAVYLGRPQHAAIPEALADEITVIDILFSEQMERATRELGKYNLHYAVRPNPLETLQRAYTPFTKGATAAACRSNMLVNRQVDDAIEFLTPDYPYLVESNAPAHVAEGFRKARDEFGGPEWHRGLDIMRSVRERVSGPAQARQFVDIVTRAAGGGAQLIPAGREHSSDPWPGEALSGAETR
jgi:hypothetical protein